MSKNSKERRKERRRAKQEAWAVDQEMRGRNSHPTREEKVQTKHKEPPPLKPMNQGQAEYINSIEHHPYIIATGHAGTSKTYIPTRIAAKWLQQDAIDKIIICRPAASDSNSLGFFKGTAEEKMEHWILPVKDTLIEVFGPTLYTYYLKIGKIVGVPFETIKGSSWKDAFIIVDEAEDCKYSEIKKALTRLGTNSTMVLAGDISQSDIAESGLGKFLKTREKSSLLSRYVDHIAFDDYSDIVRSEAVKSIIMGYDEAAGKLVLEPENDDDWYDAA